MRNVFMTIARWEGDVAEEGQWRSVVELRLPFIVALQLHQRHLQWVRGVTHGKVKGVVNSLKSIATALSPAKREANSSLIETTTLTRVSGSTSSGTQAARRGKCYDWPLANCASHNRSFTSKADMCACMSVTRMSMSSGA